MLRSQQLRANAAKVLRAGRKEAALRKQPMCPFYRELALSYKRLANLIALTPPTLRVHFSQDRNRAEANV